MSSTLDETFKRAVKPSPERLLAGVALAAAGSGMNSKASGFFFHLSCLHLCVVESCYANPEKKQHHESAMCRQHNCNSVLGLVDADIWPQSIIMFLHRYHAPFPIQYTLQMSKHTNSLNPSC
jgi:hypothetical protein